MRLFRDLLRLFDRRERWKLALISLLLFGGSLLEVVGIGVILPFVKIVGEPDSILRNERMSPWLAYLKIDHARSITLAACVALLILSLFKGVYLALTMRTAYRFIYRKVLSLGRQLLTNYLRVPYLFHLHHNTADLVKNITVETETVGNVLKFALFLPAEFIVMVGLLAVLVWAEPGTGLIGIAGLGALMWALSAFTRKELARTGKIRSDEQARMMQWVNQSLGGIKEVKLLGREDFFADAVSRSGERYTRALRRSSLLGELPRVILETSAALVIVVFVLVVVLSGRDMKTVVGALAVLGMAMVRLVPSANRITKALHGIRFYAETVRLMNEGRSMELGAGRTEREPVALSFRSTITLENLTFHYPDGAAASLHEVSLEIPRGARVAFVGASGAGKTTLANVLLGLLQPTSGRLLVDLVDVRENLRAWQDHLGYIPQDIYLIDDTIRRNIAFGWPDEKIDDASVWRALDAAQLSIFVRKLEGGLDAEVGERGVRISAGQRQRIGIARALYHDPDVLLLDEATSALDNETERQFAAAIDQLAGSKTIIIIAHRLTTVRDCDTIYLLDHGRVVASGTFDDLLREPKFAQQVVGDRRLEMPA
ncbi:MAG: ABC transporter ATP-binding protein [Spartobacteria bacterium]